MLPPNFKRRGSSNTQNAVLVRGSLTATTDQSSIGGPASSNKKAQGLGLLAVRDFQAAPYQGEPQRTEQLLKDRAAAGHAEEARCWSTASDYYAESADDVSGSV